MELAHFRELTQQSDEVYFVFDVNQNRFQYINRAFESISLRKSEDLLEKPDLALEIIHPEDWEYVKTNIDTTLTEKVRSTLFFRIVRPDRNERWIRLKVYPIVKGDQIMHISGVAEDDTARRAAISNMQKIIAWKDSSLEILSHDLRGPIGTVKMLAAAIAKKSQDNEDSHKMATMIEGVSKQTLDLLQSFLKKETIDTATVEINKERLEVVSVIQQIMDVYMKVQKALRKEFHFTASHPAIYAYLDGMKFLRIMNNLISNATKFTGDDGQINIHLERLDESILVTVADNGVGIPRSVQPVLFHKYSEASREGTQGEQSVGLGMWIIKALTDHHGGKIWFESEMNKGTTFYLEFPSGPPKA